MSAAVVPAGWSSRVAVPAPLLVLCRRQVLLLDWSWRSRWQMAWNTFGERLRELRGRLLAGWAAVAYLLPARNSAAQATCSSAASTSSHRLNPPLVSVPVASMCCACRCAQQAGLSVDQVAPRLSFFFAIGMNFFSEVGQA